MISCETCPCKSFCLARLNDTTICGCTMPLYWAGEIPLSAVMVEHRVKEETCTKK